MAPGLSSDKSSAASPFYGERFTQRLEAFSDLVFGFSLSLLATVRQYILVLVIVGFLFAMNAQLIPAEKFFSFLPAALAIVTLGTRLSIRRLPRFLDAPRS